MQERTVRLAQWLRTQSAVTKRDELEFYFHSLEAVWFVTNYSALVSSGFVLCSQGDLQHLPYMACCQN